MIYILFSTFNFVGRICFLESSIAGCLFGANPFADAIQGSYKIIDSVGMFNKGRHEASSDN